MSKELKETMNKGTHENDIWARCIKTQKLHKKWLEFQNIKGTITEMKNSLSVFIGRFGQEEKESLNWKIKKWYYLV